MSICITLPQSDFHIKTEEWREVLEFNGRKVYDQCYDFLAGLQWNRGGVYTLNAEDNAILYVGRSVNLKQRLILHLVGNDTKSRTFKGEISSISGFYVDDIADQEIYEAYAIKTLLPKYNIAKTSKIRGNYGVAEPYHRVKSDGVGYSGVGQG